MKTKLQQALKDAMKAHDKVRLDTIRSALSAIQYEEMAQKVEALSEEQILTVLKRELKKRKEQLEFAEQGKRDDLIGQFKTEIQVIEAFLPAQLSAAELEGIITGIKQQNPGTNMGGVMKALRESHAGQFDAKEASEIAKRLLGA